jgi:peptidoglycan/xylan/chitin deacetylase (PgdA/CDA1 family)
MTTIVLIWDYDTPTGYDVSHQSRHADPMSEYACTDQILGLMADHSIVSTFACVGKAADPGPPPYHNPTQIRAIHAQGHEIASHSYAHELIPALSSAALSATLTRSKQALEDCIGAPVIGFVPPWNRPFHHPRRGSISMKDFRDGGYRWRHSIPGLCAKLKSSGYQWTRIGYKTIAQRLWRNRFGRKPIVRSFERYHGVTCLPNSYFGYDDGLIAWLEDNSALDATLIVWAHPHGIEHENAQNWRYFERFCRWSSDVGKQLNVRFATPSMLLTAHANH